MDKNLSGYPGEQATPDQVRRLADEYRNAARHLLTLRRKGAPLSRAPFRFTAIHAIELYLNAFLLHRGQDAAFSTTLSKGPTAHFNRVSFSAGAPWLTCNRSPPIASISLCAMGRR